MVTKKKLQIDGTFGCFAVSRLKRASISVLNLGCLSNFKYWLKKSQKIKLEILTFRLRLVHLAKIAESNKNVCLILAQICFLGLSGEHKCDCLCTTAKTLFTKWSQFLGLHEDFSCMHCEMFGFLIHFFWLTVFTWTGILCLLGNCVYLVRYYVSFGLLYLPRQVLCGLLA